LFECLVDFRVASLIAFKNGFRKSALVSISHRAPSAVTRCPTYSVVGMHNERWEILKVPCKAFVKFSKREILYAGVTT
jgi:hypothetical protein